MREPAKPPFLCMVLFGILTIILIVIMAKGDTNTYKPKLLTEKPIGTFVSATYKRDDVSEMVTTTGTYFTYKSTPAAIKGDMVIMRVYDTDGAKSIVFRVADLEYVAY